jgi:hypothetical protein
MAEGVTYPFFAIFALMRGSMGKSPNECFGSYGWTTSSVPLLMNFE